MAKPFYILASRDSKKLAEKRADCPPVVNDLPAHYYWKDGIQVGKYKHPVKGFELNITESRLENLLSNSKRVLENGVPIPIVKDHKETADSTLGYIVDFKIEGDRLMELHQFLGDDAKNVGLRNFVSLGIDPDFVDGRGTEYGEAIAHSAITPVPVIPGQQGFVSLSKNGGQGREIDIFLLAAPHGDNMAEENNDKPSTVSPEQLARIQKILGDTENVTQENAVDALCEFAEALVDQISGDSGSGDEVKQENDQLKEQVKQLSRALPSEADASVVVEGLSEKLNLAAERGAISPAVAKSLSKILLRGDDGKINLSAVASSSAAPSLAKRVIDALAGNKIVELQRTRTGIQALGRTTPDDATKSDVDVTKMMVKMGNGEN